jgi:hypothetical protein
MFLCWAEICAWIHSRCHAQEFVLKLDHINRSGIICGSKQLDWIVPRFQILSCTWVNWLVLLRSLNGNQITSIENGAFIGLGSLTRLYYECTMLLELEFIFCVILRHMHFNLITSIEKGAFVGLSSLTYMFVSLSCMVLGLESIYLYRIRELYGNRISSIGNGVFTGLGQLTQLCAIMKRIIQYCIYAWSYFIDL